MLGRSADSTRMHDATSRAWSTTAKHCAALIALAFIARCVGLQFGLPNTLARPDEETIVANAVRLETIAGWDPDFFSYPSLLIYTAFGCFKLLQWGLRLLGTTTADSLQAMFSENPAAFHLVLRIIAALCGSLTVGVVYAAARQLFGRGTALLSALVLCLCYLHVRDSHFGVTDVPCVLLMTLSFWQLTKLHRDGRLRRLIWAAAFAGLAIGTKYTAAWLCWPFAVAIIVTARRHHRTEPVLWAVLAAILAAGLTVAVFAATTPYFFIHFEKAWDDFTWEILLVSKEPPAQPGPCGYLFYLRVALAHGLGLPVLIATLAGGVWMALRRDGRALLLWSLPVLYFLFTGRSDRVFIRYMNPVLPFLAIACGWAMRSALLELRVRARSRTLGRILGRSRASTPRSGPPQNSTAQAPETLPGRLRHRHRASVPAIVVTLAFLAPSIMRLTAFDRVAGREDTRLELRSWILAHVPPDEPVLWSGGWSALPYMFHHRPIRQSDATELLRPVLLRDPALVFQYRWIVLVEWPQVYYLDGHNATERAFLATMMKGRYELVHQIDAYKADLPPDLFCRLDHFYMSFQKPAITDQPGPGFRIYRRMDELPPTSAPGEQAGR